MQWLQIARNSNLGRLHGNRTLNRLANLPLDVLFYIKLYIKLAISSAFERTFIYRIIAIYYSLSDWSEILLM